MVTCSQRVNRTLLVLLLVVTGDFLRVCTAMCFVHSEMLNKCVVRRYCLLELCWP